MDYGNLVQSVGRKGESYYIYKTPNYSPIQAIPPIRGRQESFSTQDWNSNQPQPAQPTRNRREIQEIQERLPLQNPYIATSQNQSRPERNYLANNYLDQARNIQNDARTQKTTITPGMLLDIVA